MLAGPNIPKKGGGPIMLTAGYCAELFARFDAAGEDVPPLLRLRCVPSCAILHRSTIAVALTQSLCAAHRDGPGRQARGAAHAAG